MEVNNEPIVVITCKNCGFEDVDLEAPLDADGKGRCPKCGTVCFWKGEEPC
jgi:predicted nucleic-acid-binding Zn-ribbon protein